MTTSRRLAHHRSTTAIVNPLNLLLLLLVCDIAMGSEGKREWEERQRANNPVTSEERPPAMCPPGTLAGGVTCSGRYCDNVGLSCVRSSYRNNSRGGFFTEYVSEEQKSGVACPAGSAIAGFSCRGRYCDDIALWCAYVSPRYRAQCRTTASVSEEKGGRLGFGRGLIGVSMKCKGRYCDNKTFRVCRPSKS